MSVEEEQDVQSTHFPGHEFTQARERMHLSVEQVSTELHLPARVIRAIESGNPQSFHNPVFIRGYIRTYAKHLGLDGAHYAAIYATLPGVDLQPVTIKSTTSVKERDPSKSPFMRIFSWLFVLAILAVIVWWSKEQSGRNSIFVQDAPVVSAEVTRSVENPEDIDAWAALDRPEGDRSVVIEVDQEGLDDESAVAADDPLIEVESREIDQGVDEVVDVSAVLLMRFNGDCWVQVRDAKDTLLYSGVASGGTSLELDGDLPLSLVIGRKDAVSEIRFNGELVDLGRFSTGNVVRFSLPLRQ